MAADTNFALLRLTDGSVALIYPDAVLIIEEDGRVLECPRPTKPSTSHPTAPVRSPARDAVAVGTTAS